MHHLKVPTILVEDKSIQSEFLEREVNIEFFKPQLAGDNEPFSLLLINDGQDMKALGLSSILEKLYEENVIRPLLCVGIHCGPLRKMEYGIAGTPDYLGRGAKAELYTRFILEELLPFILRNEQSTSFEEKALAGFSLGGLSAMDITWKHRDIFNKVGMFSASFWWRSIDQTDEEYDDDQHRIIHQLVRNGEYRPGTKFYFQCGNLDETRDRNKNGIIDSIDDTQDLIKELESKGYALGKDIQYVELKDGRHDVASWSRAMPGFLKWGWGR